MKNKEKYFDQLIELIKGGNSLAIRARDGQFTKCYGMKCAECLFGRDCRFDCEMKRAEWLDAEYVAPEKMDLSFHIGMLLHRIVMSLPEDYYKVHKADFSALEKSICELIEENTELKRTNDV